MEQLVHLLLTTYQTKGELIMGFFKNLGEELGSGTGKGINAVVASLWRGFLFFLSYLFRIERRPDQHVLRTNTIRIAVWFLLIALIFTEGLVSCSFKLPDLSLSGLTEAKKIKVLINLKKKHIPFFPTNEKFEPVFNSNVIPGEPFGDNMTLALYNENELKVKNEKDNTCFIVPAGKKLMIFSNSPPLFVANMDNKVSYAEKMEAISFLKSHTIVIWYVLFRDLKYFTVTSNTWHYLYNHWSDVEMKDHGLLVKALNKKDIPDNVAGGLVCF